MEQEIDNLDELKSLLEAQMRELGKRLEASIINKETKKGLKECKASKGLKECKATPAIDRQKTLPEIPVSAKGSSECEKIKGVNQTNLALVSPVQDKIGSVSECVKDKMEPALNYGPSKPSNPVIAQHETVNDIERQEMEKELLKLFDSDEEQNKVETIAPVVRAVPVVTAPLPHPAFGQKDLSALTVKPKKKSSEHPLLYSSGDSGESSGEESSESDDESSSSEAESDAYFDPSNPGSYPIDASTSSHQNYRPVAPAIPVAPLQPPPLNSGKFNLVPILGLLQDEFTKESVQTVFHSRASIFEDIDSFLKEKCTKEEFEDAKSVPMLSIPAKHKSKFLTWFEGLIRNPLPQSPVIPKKRRAEHLPTPISTKKSAPKATRTSRPKRSSSFYLQSPTYADTSRPWRKIIQDNFPLISIPTHGSSKMALELESEVNSFLALHGLGSGRVKNIPYHLEGEFLRWFRLELVGSASDATSNPFLTPKQNRSVRVRKRDQVEVVSWPPLNTPQKPKKKSFVPSSLANLARGRLSNQDPEEEDKNVFCIFSTKSQSYCCPFCNYNNEQLVEMDAHIKSCSGNLYSRNLTVSSNTTTDSPVQKELEKDAVSTLATPPASVIRHRELSPTNVEEPSSSSSKDSLVLTRGVLFDSTQSKPVGAPPRDEIDEFFNPSKNSQATVQYELDFSSSESPELKSCMIYDALPIESVESTQTDFESSPELTSSFPTSGAKSLVLESAIHLAFGEKVNQPLREDSDCESDELCCGIPFRLDEYCSDEPASPVL